MAISKLVWTNAPLLADDMDQPTTLREHKSKSTDKYSQPLRVSMKVTSPAQTSLGRP